MLAKKRIRISFSFDPNETIFSSGCRIRIAPLSARSKLALCPHGRLPADENAALTMNGSNAKAALQRWSME